MSSFLITFKPLSESPKRGWPLESLQKLAKRLQRTGHLLEPWRFINKNVVKPGDRAFLLLQGKLGPAIIGYGRITEKKGPRWREIKFEALVNPIEVVLVESQQLISIEGSTNCWRTQASGILLPESVAAELETLVVGKRSRFRTIGLPINRYVTSGRLLEASEGRRMIRIHLARERNRKLVESKRAQALVKYGRLFCEVCRSDFKSTYGSVCAGVIECHHIRPLSYLTKTRNTHLDDLALVCANCHRVLHKGGHTIKSLRRFVRREIRPR